MTTAIVVPAWNRYDLTVDCLHALVATAPDARVVLVDNGSTDDTANLLGDVTVRFSKNQGFAAGCNAGAAGAGDADCIIFLNNDTVPQDGWLEPLERTVSNGAAVAGARLVYPTGAVQHAGVTLVRLADGALEARNRRRDHRSGPVAAVTGACMAVDPRWFDLVGGFDEGYWNGYEDVDLCLSVTKRGGQVAYVAESTVVHLESQSGSERWSAVDENIARLQMKWG